MPLSDPELPAPLKAAIESALVGVIVTDARQADNPIVYLNPAFERITGYGREEVLGRNPRFMQGPQTDPETRSFMHRAGQTGCAFHRRVLNYRADGSPFWNDLHVSPIVDESGAVIGHIGLICDVTQQAEDEVAARLGVEAGALALRESEERYARIVANVPGMVYQFLLTAAGAAHFTFVSDCCREIYGREPAEILADAGVLLNNIHPDFKTSFFETVAQSAATLEPWLWEGQVITPSGPRWIRAHSRPVRHANGDTLWDGVVLDVTASKNAEEALRHSQMHLAQAQKIAHLGSYIWDRESDTALWSPEMYEIFGVTSQEFMPAFDAVLSFIYLADRPEIEARVGDLLASGRSMTSQFRIRRADGVERTLLSHTSAEADGNGQFKRLVGTVQDVTEMVLAQSALRESEERYALAALATNDGLWDWDLATNHVYFSPRWKEMLGLDAQEPLETIEAWFGRVHPEDRDRLQSACIRHLELGGEAFECEYRVEYAGGAWRWMIARGLAVRDAHNRATRLAGSQSDITARKEAEAQLSRNAFYDGLTGLPNRALFLERLERTLTRARRNANHAFAVLFLDLDRFKKINDSLGHLPGDQLLQEAAARFQTCLRIQDTVARLGGDEFAILLDELEDENAAHEVAGRVQQQLERPITLDGKDVYITASIGIVWKRGDSESAAELLRNADTAMYRAKALGRARHELFDQTMHQHAVKALELETDLWRALERHELFLHYQPIIALESGQISGFEALVRWQHPTRGLVSPGDFIPLAEESGLIVPIGWWVLEEACRQASAWAKKWPQTPPLTMAVNLSSKQFSQEDMTGHIRGALGTCECNTHLLTLEITESVLMENTESASTMLRELRASGIQLAMDDFGTGYSSLSYLHRFPLDSLKIDRSFVSQMRAEGSGGEIVGTILSLANGLNLKVVAEGVETAEQLALLRERGCQFAQGFYFSRPLTAQAVEELVEKEPRW